MARAGKPKPASRTTSDLARAATERSELYGLLARLFRNEPDRELLTQLRSPDLRNLLGAIGIDLGEEFFDRSVEEIHDKLAVEYTFLFLGPGKHIAGAISWRPEPE